MAEVNVTLSKTIQDNYEPIRIEIGVTDTVRADEKVSDAVDRVYTLVENKLLLRVREELHELGRAK
jgi:hypothetical protein